MRTCFIVADGKRATIFQMEALEDRPRKLIEAQVLGNPEHGQRGDRFSAGRSEASMQGSGGRHYSLDDHRGRHDAVSDEKFAKHVVEHVRDFARAHALNRIVWVAEPRTLGRLRPHFELLGKELKAIDEVPRDLCHLDVKALEAELGAEVY